MESENRNISPRNDLLRNRRCVGIIQAAAAAKTPGTFSVCSRRWRERFRRGPDVRTAAQQTHQPWLSEPRVCGTADTEQLRQRGSQSYFRGRSNAVGLLIKCFLIPFLRLLVPVLLFFVGAVYLACGRVCGRWSERPAMIAQFHLIGAPSLTDHPFDSSTPHNTKHARAHKHTQTHKHTVTISLSHTHTLRRRWLSEQYCLASPFARSTPMNEAGRRAGKARQGRQAASPPRQERKRSSTPVGVNAKQTGAAFKRRSPADPKFEAMQRLLFFIFFI